MCPSSQLNTRERKNLIFKTGNKYEEMCGYFYAIERILLPKFGVVTYARVQFSDCTYLLDKHTRAMHPT